jgi:FkbM family methyltransferase
MSLPRSPYRPYLRMVHRPVLALLQWLGQGRLMRQWIRISNRDYAWPLPGLLEGHVMQLASRDDYQYLEPEYEPRVCAAILRLVKPGYLCADIGAHIGYMTLLMAKLVGEKGRVFSFEALPENAQVLECNVALNGWQERVDVENRAVSDRSQTACVMHRGRTSFESSLMSGDGGDSFTVPATALDDYFAYRTQLDFIKMDIEGGEAKAMLGMEKVLKRTRPTILLEVHDSGWAALDELLAADYALHDLDFRVVTVDQMRSQRMNHCVAVPIERPLKLKGEN